MQGSIWVGNTFKKAAASGCPDTAASVQRKGSEASVQKSLYRFSVFRYRVEFLSYDKEDNSQSQHDYACPSCYLYHQPEVAHDTGAICFKIIGRTPRAFIPYKEEGSYSADKSEQQEEESESLYVAQSQLGLRVDRIVLRIFLVKSAIYPLADRIEYHSRNDGDESKQEILRSVYIEADNAYDERAAADIYRRQLALYIVEISSLLNRILFSDLYISK